MEALLVLIALTAITGVLIVPAMRRGLLRRRGALAGGGTGTAVDPAASYGFVPAGQLDVRLPGPDPELVEALEETQRTQDWQPVARLLAFTGDEWELRWQRVQSLAGAAAMELARSRASGASADAGADAAGASGGGVSFLKSGDAAGSGSNSGPNSGSSVPSGPGGSGASAGQDARWLRHWRAQQPRDAGCAQVYAQFLVWQALADPSSADRAVILEEARTICRDAAESFPADPTPHITELVIARHLSYRRADFESLWSAVRRLAPHHMGAHLAALSYWSERCCGSREDAEAFAQGAAAHAPEGTLLPALPLFAVYEHLPEVNVVRGLYQSATVENAVEAAEFAVDQVEDDHPVRPHVLHLLVWLLVRAARYEEALEALQFVDGYVGALPWAESEDPAGTYVAYRALALAGWEATGGARAQL